MCDHNSLKIAGMGCRHGDAERPRPAPQDFGRRGAQFPPAHRLAVVRNRRGRRLSDPRGGPQSVRQVFT